MAKQGLAELLKQRTTDDAIYRLTCEIANLHAVQGRNDGMTKLKTQSVNETADSRPDTRTMILRPAIQSDALNDVHLRPVGRSYVCTPYQADRLNGVRGRTNASHTTQRRTQRRNRTPARPDVRPCARPNVPSVNGQ